MLGWASWIETDIKKQFWNGLKLQPMTILLKSGYSVLNKKVNFHLLAFGNNFNLLIQKCDEIFEEFFQS